MTIYRNTDSNSVKHNVNSNPLRYSGDCKPPEHLLTDSQIREALNRVNEAYAEASRMATLAARKEKRWKRYIKRHYGEE